MSRIRGTGETLTLLGATLEQVAAWAEAVHRGGRGRLAVAPGPEGLDATAVAALVAAGVDELRVRLYAVDVAAHDYHAGVEGSGRATIAMLRAARTAGLRARVTTPVTRSNARVLGGLPGLLADVAAAGWCVVVPDVPPHRRPESWDDEPRRPGSVRVEGAPPPRLAIVVPYALQAIAAAERAGIPAAIENVPMCLLGPMRDRGLQTPRREHAEACAGCPALTSCPGVDGGYLERFGAAELSPRGVVREGDPARCRRLRDLFTEISLALGECTCWPI